MDVCNTSVYVCDSRHNILVSCCAVLKASEPSGRMTPSAVPISSPAPTAEIVCSRDSDTLRKRGARPAKIIKMASGAAVTRP